MSFDLTNKNIKDTFQNLLQRTGSDNRLYDLLGNEIGDLRISGSLIAQQYIVSSSVTNITTQQLSGSTQFGDSSDDTHLFTGNITASGNISSSEEIIAKSAEFQRGAVFNNSGGTFVTQIKGNTDDNLFLTNVNPSGIDKIAIGGVEFPSKLTINGDLTTTSHITASGEISASGRVTTLQVGKDSTDQIDFSTDNVLIFRTGNNNRLRLTTGALRPNAAGGIKLGTTGTPFGALHLQGDITASGNISASGDILCDNVKTMGRTALGTTLSDTKGVLFSDNNITQIQIGKEAVNVSTTIHGNITASGNIKSGGNLELTASSAGNITASGNMALGTGGGVHELSFGNSSTLKQILNNNTGFQFTSGSTVMGTFADATGNFGIGTETPGQKLEVVGNISASGQLIAKGANFNDESITNVGTITLDAIEDDASGGDTKIEINGTTMNIDVGGATILETTATTAKFSVPIETTSHITASGNISASGDVLNSQVVQMTNSSSVINTFNTGSHQTCKYVLQVTSGSFIQSSEMLVVQSGSNAFNTEYAQIGTAVNLGSFSTSVSGNVVKLSFAGDFISCSVKFNRTLI